jgi:hypothetical protein
MFGPDVDLDQDLHRQAHQFRLHLTDVAVRPLVGPRGRSVDHHVGIPTDSGRVERWLDGLALALPQLAPARHKAVAERLT